MSMSSWVMLKTASKREGISVLLRRAQLKTRLRAQSNFLPLEPFFFWQQYSRKEGLGSVSQSVLSATMLMTASTISSCPMRWLSSRMMLGQLMERSPLTQTLTLPSSSTQIWFSSTMKYLECSQMRAQPSSASMSMQRLSGKGMSLISLRRSLTCSMQTLAMQLQEQISSRFFCSRKREFTMFSCLLRQLYDFRQQRNSSSLPHMNSYSSTFSPVLRWRSVRYSPQSSGISSSSGRYSHSSALNAGVSMFTDCLDPINSNYIGPQLPPTNKLQPSLAGLSQHRDHVVVLGGVHGRQVLHCLLEGDLSLVWVVVDVLEGPLRQLAVVDEVQNANRLQTRWLVACQRVQEDEAALRERSKQGGDQLELVQVGCLLELLEAEQRVVLDCVDDGCVDRTQVKPISPRCQQVSEGIHKRNCIRSCRCLFHQFRQYLLQFLVGPIADGTCANGLAQYDSQRFWAKLLEIPHQLIILTQLLQILDFFGFGGHNRTILRKSIQKLCLYFALQFLTDFLLLEGYLLGVELVLLPAFNIGDAIVAEGVDELLLHFGRKVVVLEAVEVVVDACVGVSGDGANIESAHQDAGCAHDARVERSKDGQFLRRRKGELLPVGEVPVDHALLAVTSRVNHELPPLNPRKHSVATRVEHPSLAIQQQPRDCEGPLLSGLQLQLKDALGRFLQIVEFVHITNTQIQRSGLVALDLHVVEAEHLVLLEGAVAQELDYVPVLLRREGVLQEGLADGVDQPEGELALAPAHLHEGFQQLLHAVAELLVAVDEGVVAAEVVVDLLDEPLNGGKHSAEGAVVELELHLRDLHVAGLALEEVALEVAFVLNVEGEHEGLLADSAAVLGFGGVVAAVVAGEAHDDEVGEVGHAGAAGGHLPGHEAHLAVHLELHRLVAHEVLLLEGLHEVQPVPVELAPLLQPQLLLRAARVVAHRQQLLPAAPELPHLHVLVDPRREGVLDVRVAARVAQPKGHRELPALGVPAQPVQEAQQLGLRLLPEAVAPKRQREVFVGPQQDGLDGGDLGPVGGRQGELQLLDLDAAVLGADDLAVEVRGREAAEEDLDAEVGQTARELHLVIGLAAVRAGEGADEYLSEERDGGEEDGGLSGLVAAGTLGVSDRGWIATHLPSGCSLILTNGLTGWSMQLTIRFIYYLAYKRIRTLSCFLRFCLKIFAAHFLHFGQSSLTVKR